ncbi:hypothetical protein DAEQUDRAFT_727911 [Daedalea quercina L-15889]|uniref:Uncharacterized protein n=1 Tax=Daedalea quercina L-15889 TaxID=1314783 RepID=A0A165PL81_9APHY|nr:hypothetical protein DAEQUDRAFT_727911 [Daedalea quercina L-15889]
MSSGNRRRRGADDVGGRMAFRTAGISSAPMGLHRRIQVGPTASKPSWRGDRGDNDGATRNDWVVGPHLSVHKFGEAGDDSDRDDDRYEIARATKSGRKQTVGPVTSGNMRSTAWVSLPNTNIKAARKTEINDDDVIELSSSSDEGENIDQLARALDALTLTTSRLQQYKQLPFLLRNLRKGFRRRCEKAGIRTNPERRLEETVGVVYRYDWDDGANEDSGNESDHIYEEWQGRMDSWSCPLCQLHGHFDTREMLGYHLRLDHNEVKVEWTRANKREGETWEIVLTIPDIKEDTRSLSVEDPDFDSDQASVSPQGVPPESRSPSPMPVSPVIRAQSPSRETLSEEQTLLRSPKAPPIDQIPEPSEPPRSPLLIPKKFRAPSPTVSTSAQVSSTRTRSTTARPQRQHTVSTRGSLPARYPSPPPPSDPHGPAAQYPYIPEGEYSCRPGGPKIYDLLSSVSLEPFGVLSWMIVDREEELFELDDVRDEDKVMMALWNRWIVLHRHDFIFKGYFKGIIAFVDEYWRMIHRAAGWGALRAFLLMLTANRFLTPSQVVKVLKHYEGYTGMDYWYKDAPSEEPN